MSSSETPVNVQIPSDDSSVTSTLSPEQKDAYITFWQTWLIILLGTSTFLALLLFALAIFLIFVLRFKLLRRYRCLYKALITFEVYVNKQQMGPVTEKKFCERIGKTPEEVMNERDDFNRLAYQRENHISFSEMSKTDVTRTKEKEKQNASEKKTKEKQPEIDTTTFESKDMTTDTKEQSKDKTKEPPRDQIKEQPKDQVKEQPKDQIKKPSNMLPVDASMMKAMQEEDYEMLDDTCDLKTRKSVINPIQKPPSKKSKKSNKSKKKAKENGAK